jgi:hypothetical protein
MRRNTERSIRRLDAFYVKSRLLPLIIAAAILLPVLFLLFLVFLRKITGGLL